MIEDLKRVTFWEDCSTPSAWAGPIFKLLIFYFQKLFRRPRERRGLCFIPRSNWPNQKVSKMRERRHTGTMLFLGACSLLTFYLNVNSEDKKIGSFPLGLNPFASTHWIQDCVVILHCSTFLGFARTVFLMLCFFFIFRCPGEVLSLIQI